jgi:hypothetical protein
VGDQSDSEGKPNLALAYQRVGESYETITEFRAKLLTLLPLATGTGAFLLLERAQKETDGSQFRRFLGPIGIFSVVVTLACSLMSFAGCSGVTGWRCRRLSWRTSSSCA